MDRLATMNRRGARHRIAAVFRRLRRERRVAFIPFVVAGHPTLAATASLAQALDRAGADLIELGVPFSDPLADGPVIQAASSQALARGATPRKVLALASRLRRRVRAPLVALTYWNPVLQFGGNGSARGRAPGDAFLRAAARAGIAGVIVPDLPADAAGAFRAAAARHGVATVFLATPTSSPARLRAIARASEGFIYYVSVTGTTGVRRALAPELLKGVRQLKLLTTKPVCVGFGISTPQQARAVGRVADGVIVGSAIVRAIQSGSPAGAARRVQRLATGLRRAL
jgi:tryptophan synthase alpha chain